MPDNKFASLFEARGSNKDPQTETEDEKQNEVGAQDQAGEHHDGVEATESRPQLATPTNSLTQDRPTQKRSSSKDTRGDEGNHVGTPQSSASERRRPGRPPGKRSNPDYEQATIYIRKDTHRAVKVALLQREDTRQFSELVEDLLQQWVET